MKVSKQLLFGSFLFLAALLLTPGARASQWDQKVVATFNGPVEIPGQVLPTGTYVFKVVDVVGMRDLVQVTNADESQVLATAFTVPRYRSVPTSNAVFVFQERSTTSPQALQAWYYPGYIDGHQFIYTSKIAPEAVTASNAAPPAPTEQPVATQPQTAEESAPVMSAENNASEPAPAPVADEAQNNNQNDTTATPAPSAASNQSTNQNSNELPKTASNLPLIGLLGILALGGAMGLKLLAVRAS